MHPWGITKLFIYYSNILTWHTLYVHRLTHPIYLRRHCHDRKKIPSPFFILNLRPSSPPLLQSCCNLHAGVCMATNPVWKYIPARVSIHVTRFTCIWILVCAVRHPACSPMGCFPVPCTCKTEIVLRNFLSPIDQVNRDEAQ